MNKKLLALTLAVSLICAAAGVGTMAWFTSSATSSDNTFTAGTLILGSEDLEANKFATLNIDNIEPGQPVHTGETLLKNIGSLPLKLYRINASNFDGDGLLDEQLTIRAYIIRNNEEPLQVYEGTLWDLRYENGGFFNPVYNVGAQEEVTLSITVEMEEDAGNSYQGLSRECDLTVYAAQDNMPLPGQTGEWEYLTGSNGELNGFDIKGKTTENEVMFDLDWWHIDNPIYETYEVYIKHHTGSPDSAVGAIRILWRTSEYEIISGELTTDDVEVNFSKDIIVIDKDALPEDWEVIDVKIRGLEGVLWHETNYEGWFVR